MCFWSVALYGPDWDLMCTAGVLEFCDSTDTLYLLEDCEFDFSFLFARQIGVCSWFKDRSKDHVITIDRIVQRCKSSCPLEPSKDPHPKEYTVSGRRLPNTPPVQW